MASWRTISRSAEFTLLCFLDKQGSPFFLYVVLFFDRSADAIVRDEEDKLAGQLSWK